MRFPSNPLRGKKKVEGEPFPITPKEEKEGGGGKVFKRARRPPNSPLLRRRGKKEGRNVSRLCEKKEEEERSCGLSESSIRRKKERAQTPRIMGGKKRKKEEKSAVRRRRESLRQSYGGGNRYQRERAKTLTSLPGGRYALYSLRQEKIISGRKTEPELLSTAAVTGKEGKRGCFSYRGMEERCTKGKRTAASYVENPSSGEALEREARKKRITDVLPRERRGESSFSTGLSC